MQTLNEYNADRIAARKVDRHDNGIACPECGKALFDATDGLVLTSDPPRVAVSCVCGFAGSRII